MRKPVSLAPAGGSLREPLAAVSPKRAVKSAPQAEAASVAALAPEIEVATQVAEASVKAPAGSTAAAMTSAVVDFWHRQADAYWEHGVALAQAGTLSQMIETHGHFVRQQVEAAREQAALWASLVNQTSGLSPVEKLPPVSFWTPWPAKADKSGG